jgi:hypothetical protein
MPAEPAEQPTSPQAVSARLEVVLTEFAASLLSAVASAKHVSPYHLALAVPGLCHAHWPDDRAAVPGCAYCRRRGNMFANSK